MESKVGHEPVIDTTRKISEMSPDETTLQNGLQALAMAKRSLEANPNDPLAQQRVEMMQAQVDTFREERGMPAPSDETT